MANLNKFYFFIAGIIAGFFWLNPVFQHPSVFFDGGIRTSNVERILRISSLALLLSITYSKQLRANINFSPYYWLLTFFLAAPLISSAIWMDTSYLLYKCGPILMSGVVLFFISNLKDESLKTLALGIGIITIIYFLRGLATYGLETTQLWGRTRVHLGFYHPIQTASVVAYLAAFSILCNQTIFRNYKLLSILATSATVTISMILLLLVQSRNTFLFFITFGIAYLTFRFIIKSPSFRFLSYLSIVILINLFFVITLFLSFSYGIDTNMNDISSGRLNMFQNEISSFANGPLQNILFGDSAGDKGRTAGFSSSHSVMISILLNYGTMALILFWGLNLSIAHNLSKTASPLPLAALISTNIFFVSDTQGLTTSNLAIFLLFAFSFRAAVNQARKPIPLLDKRSTRVATQTPRQL